MLALNGFFCDGLSVKTSLQSLKTKEHHPHSKAVETWVIFLLRAQHDLPAWRANRQDRVSYCDEEPSSHEDGCSSMTMIQNIVSR